MKAFENGIVARVRANFLRHALARVREKGARGVDFNEALAEAAELRRYFEWVKQDMPTEEQAQLGGQFSALPVSRER